MLTGAQTDREAGLCSVISGASARSWVAGTPGASVSLRGSSCDLSRMSASRWSGFFPDSARLPRGMERRRKRDSGGVGRGGKGRKPPVAVDAPTSKILIGIYPGSKAWPLPH